LLPGRATPDIQSIFSLLGEKWGARSRELAYPQFLGKEPFVGKTPGGKRREPMGFRPEKFGSSS